jgi:hypothetical protein
MVPFRLLAKRRRSLHKQFCTENTSPRQPTSIDENTTRVGARSRKLMTALLVYLTNVLVASQTTLVQPWDEEHGSPDVQKLLSVHPGPPVELYKSISAERWSGMRVHSTSAGCTMALPSSKKLRAGTPTVHGLRMMPDGADDEDGVIVLWSGYQGTTTVPYH